jgi:TrpR family trp operon transcriptional repressor
MSNTTKDGWQEFLKLCLTIKSTKELNEFFNLFLTIEEKETLASRFLIVKSMLEEELTQREISEKHKVSIAQITRGSNALKIISKDLRAKLKSRLT